MAGNGIGRLAGSGIGRLAGKGGVAPVGVVGRQISRTALHGAAIHRMAVGVVQVGVLCCPVSRVAVARGMAWIWALCWRAGRAERGRAGRLQRWRAVRAQAVASPARRPDWGNVWLAGVDGIVGVVLTLAGGCPARAAGLPGLVVFRLFIAVAHANSTAQPLLRAPEEVFNKLLRQTMMRLCRPDPGAQRIRQSQRATPGTGSAVHTSDNYPARDAAVSLSLGAPRAWCCSRGRRW